MGYKHDADIAIWAYDLVRDTLLQRMTLELNKKIEEDFYQENRGMTAATAQGTIAYAYRYKNQIDFLKLSEDGQQLQIIKNRRSTKHEHNLYQQSRDKAILCQPHFNQRQVLCTLPERK